MTKPNLAKQLAALQAAHALVKSALVDARAESAKLRVALAEAGQSGAPGLRIGYDLAGDLGLHFPTSQAENIAWTWGKLPANPELALAVIHQVLRGNQDLAAPQRKLGTSAVPTQDQIEKWLRDHPKASTELGLEDLKDIEL